MKKKRKLVLPILVILFLAVIGLCVLSMMPLYGDDKECDTSEGGNSIAINGHIMWYRMDNAEGKGTPIYVLAGGPGFSTDYMENYLEFLSENHPVIFYDGRCSGRSEYTADLSDCTYENYAEDVEVLRQRLTPDQKIILMAHSSGGVTAMAYLDKYEENLEGAVFISSVGYKTKVVFSDEYIHTGFPPFNQRYANSWFSINIKELYGDYIVNKEVENILDNTKINYALMMKNEAKDTYNYEKTLKKSSIPALILSGGEKDTPMTGKEEAQQLHELLENSTLYQFQHSGHFCFAEEPEIFQKKVNKFIENLSTKKGKAQ